MVSARLETAVGGFLADHLVAGAGVAVIQNGTRIEIVDGVADMESHKPVTELTQFRVASVTNSMRLGRTSS